MSKKHLEKYLYSEKPLTYSIILDFKENDFYSPYRKNFSKPDMLKKLKREILKFLLNKKELNSLTSAKKLNIFGFQELGNTNNEDVFIIGYPKSGNTLLQHIVAHLVFGLRKDAPKSLINSCVTEWYNNPMFFRHEKRHFFKSHELPDEKFKKVIYIIRDGRDAVRSYYYMQKNLGKNVSLDDLYSSGGKTFRGTWASHVDKWTANKYKADILYIKYEDLLKNKRNEIDRICSFLGIERTDQEIKNVLEATSFENMKTMEKSYSWSRMKSFKDWKKEGNFVREGKSGGFKLEDNLKKPSLDNFISASRSMLEEYKYL